MPDTVLIVEDEAPVRELLTTWLEEAGYAPRSAANGIEGLREVYQARSDVIVADILMPQMDGFELCKLVREVTDAPIMFLTSLGEEQRKLEGLNLGADVYIVKPVGMDEFLARIAALLRRRARSQQATGEPRRYADPMLNIDFDRHEARINGLAMDLTPTEFRLLWFLAQHAGRTCSVRDILENVWDPRTTPRTWSSGTSPASAPSWRSIPATPATSSPFGAWATDAMLPALSSW
ncbi:MAG: response regulator transcription factor [SAR202 cluster bacterium]|nr:response regulator transcription factor [SAR202 cluster bacterium]